MSPDQTRVAADFLEFGNDRFNGKQFLGVFDLRTNRLTKVLPSQVLGNYYYPSWTSNGTLLVSFACRCDSVSMVWEVDTNGVFLRKLVGRESFDILMSAESPPPAPVTPMVVDIHPQPASEEVNIRVQHIGRSVVEVFLHDILGRQIDASCIGSPMAGGDDAVVSFRVGALPPGPYLIVIRTAGQAPLVRPFLVMR
ncbi:MAG: hypothetical protein IPP94_16135 [Ignavibacteria bacterium]|nr:hypothetical protein [Ignavibacteria bacterium]